jgi:hypothetical protein
MYKTIALRRDGKQETWYPLVAGFTQDTVDAYIEDKRTAIKEFSFSLREANAEDHLRVYVAEQDKDGVWRDTSDYDTSRFFKQDERSIASIDKTVFSRSLDLLSISMQIYQMMELTYLSSDTKEWLRELSTKLTDISNEMCRLKEQIKEEYYNDIQDTEN